LTTARMIYIVEADAAYQRSYMGEDEDSFGFDVYSVDFTDEEISKKVTMRYNDYLHSTVDQEALDKRINFFINAYGMSYQDRMDYFYQTLGYKDQADYEAQMAARDEAENKIKKAEEDRINAERAKQGLGSLWPDEM